MTGRKAVQILENDDISAAACGYEAEIGTAKPLRGIQRSGA